MLGPARREYALKAVDAPAARLHVLRRMCICATLFDGLPDPGAICATSPDAGGVRISGLFRPRVGGRSKTKAACDIVKILLPATRAGAWRVGNSLATDGIELGQSSHSDARTTGCSALASSR